MTSSPPEPLHRQWLHALEDDLAVPSRPLQVARVIADFAAKYGDGRVQVTWSMLRHCTHQSNDVLSASIAWLAGRGWLLDEPRKSGQKAWRKLAMPVDNPLESTPPVRSAPTGGSAPYGGSWTTPTGGSASTPTGGSTNVSTSGTVDRGPAALPAVDTSTSVGRDRGVEDKDKILAEFAAGRLARARSDVASLRPCSVDVGELCKRCGQADHTTAECPTW